MKKSIFYRLIYGNRAMLVCLFFTIATMLDLILSVFVAGVYEDTYGHLATRFILCVLASLSLIIFRYFPKLSLLIVFIMHFLITLITQIFYTWISGFFIDLHPDAYRDMIRTILIIYPILMIGCAMLDFFQTARVNQILKKNAR